MTEPAYCTACKHHSHAPGRCVAQPNGGVVCCDCEAAAPPRSSAGSCHDHGNCELCDQQEAEIARLLALARFGALCADAAFDADAGYGGLDGDDVQEWALAAGVLVEKPSEEQHDEYCEACAEGGPCYVIPKEVLDEIEAQKSKAVAR